MVPALITWEEEKMVITIQNFLELKKIMEDRCHTEIHYHESCDRQHFSTDKPLSREAKLFLQDYFSKWHQKVQFYDADRQFTLVDL